MKNNNIKFERQVSINYYEDNGKYRVYKCDLHLLDTNEYIEIKGDQMLDENGNLKVFYKSDTPSKINAKKKCMIENKIIILSRKEVEQYFNYFKENCKIPIINNRTNEIGKIRL